MFRQRTKKGSDMSRMDKKEKKQMEMEQQAREEALEEELEAELPVQEAQPQEAQPAAPTQEELDVTLPLINSDDLLVEEGRAYLAREGMIANLGAIAKGYIADRVKDLLVEQGVEHAVIDLGRNILLIGGRPDGSNFTVGVQDPNQEEGVLADTVAASDKSVVTSGINERKFTYNGKEYHHVLDPFTGFPADTGLASVTILSDNSAQGDALSTTCLLLGPEEGMQLIESLDGVEALFITTDGELIPSSGYEAYRYQA